MVSFHSLPALRVLTCLLWIAPQAVAQEARALAGLWEGEIKLPGAPLSITVEFRTDDRGGLAGRLSIPMEGAWDLPLGEVETKGESVRFRVADMPGGASFEGRLSVDMLELRGTFRQNGQAFLFRLRHRPARQEEGARGSGARERPPAEMEIPQGV